MRGEDEAAALRRRRCGASRLTRRQPVACSSVAGARTFLGLARRRGWQFPRGRGRRQGHTGVNVVAHRQDRERRDAHVADVDDAFGGAILEDAAQGLNVVALLGDEDSPMLWGQRVDEVAHSQRCCVRAGSSRCSSLQRTCARTNCPSSASGSSAVRLACTPSMNASRGIPSRPGRCPAWTRNASR